MADYLALGKWRRLLKMIRNNGGLFKTGYKMWRYDTLKDGKYVGCDCNGNKYYMNNNYMIGRSRWVEYNMNYRWDYEATQITSEWYGWIHYKTDKLPCDDPAKSDLLSSVHAQNWLQPCVENMTGFDEAYYPYGTTRPKINLWDGKTYFIQRGLIRNTYTISHTCNNVATKIEKSLHGLVTLRGPQL